MCLHRKEKGWTIIELMVVVILIGILVLVVVASFGNIRSRSHESSTKGSLGALRSAISTYYADNDGQWPNDLEVKNSTSFNGRYIDEIPLAKLKIGLGESDRVIPDDEVNLGDLGGWLYNSDTGHITINHWRDDTKGTCYSTY